MRLDEISTATIRRHMMTMDEVFAGGKRPNLDTFVGHLQRATRGWTDHQFEAACQATIQSCRYFPTIKEIIENRPPSPVARREEDRSQRECGRCGVVPYVAGYENFRGVVPRMRCDCDPIAGFLTPAAVAATKGFQADFAREVYAIEDGATGVSAALQLLVNAGNAPRGGSLSDDIMEAA